MYLTFLFSHYSLSSPNQLYAVTLMSNHTHEVYKIEDVENFSNQMRQHHSKYGLFFNKKHKRCGKVAQDRPKTCLIGDEDHEMRVIFYIHANPVRAKMVRDAKDYYWSTHQLYAYGRKQPWMRHIVFPGWYLKLGTTMRERQEQYIKLFNRYLKQQGLVYIPIFRKHFYGPIMWVLTMQKPIRAWYQNHGPPKSS